MRISRLRLRLAVWFGITFLLGLLILGLGFLSYASGQAEAQLTREVAEAAGDVRDAIRRESLALPQVALDSVVHEALDEWPATPDAIAVFDRTGRRIGSRGPAEQLALLDVGRLGPGPLGTFDRRVNSEGGLRAAWVRDSQPGVTIITASSTAALQEHQEALRGWLLASLPLIGLGAAAAGYGLARRALRPVKAMARELDDIDERRIEQRLLVRQPPDELDQLATHFNALLDRLARARATNLRFLGHVAHQLRTPLTIVRGESTLGLERIRVTEDYRAALRRIDLAAEQMSRRVADLFLLAEAEAGELPLLASGVELDGIAVEVVDLMRGRASALARALEFGRIEAVSVRGNGPLLREAVVELVENACRHGSGEGPVRVEVFQADGQGVVRVSNAGPPIPKAEQAAGSGLGLSILRWVADTHQARLAVRRDDGVNVVSLEFHLEAQPA